MEGLKFILIVLMGLINIEVGNLSIYTTKINYNYTH